MKRAKVPFHNILLCLASGALLLLQMPAFAQRLKVVTTPAPKSDGFSSYYLLAFIFGIVISGIVFWWLRSRSSDKDSGKDRRYAREPQRKRGRVERRVQDVDDGTSILSEFENVIKKNKEIYRRLPILAIRSLPEPKPFEPLPDFSDDDLLKAIRHSNVDHEPDESVRRESLQALSNFRTTAAIDAVAQVALYDLSSGLRSQALSVLADYDHEVVFESILLACSDPAREVQTAAARALLQVSFDRTEAWIRIIRTSDSVLLSQSARAVITAGFLERTYDRLLHNEPQSAEEAFAIIALLIRAGETTEIFEEIEQPRDPRVARALLHVIEIIREPKVIDDLVTLSETFEMDPSLQKTIDRITAIMVSRDLCSTDLVPDYEESEVESPSCVA